MNRILVLLIILSASCIQAQSLKPAISVGQVSVDGEVSSALNSKLTKRLGSNYQVLTDTYVTLSADATLGKVSTINGMDTYATTDADVTYRVKVGPTSYNPITITTKCKGNSERDLRYKIGSSIVRDRNHVEQLEEYISEAISKSLGSCSAISKEIDSAIAKKNSNQAYGLLGYFDVDECASQLDQYEDKILQLKQQELCANVTQSAKILANSSKREDLEKATNLLLSIPPDSSCAEEAIIISEVIAENAKSLSSYSGKNIQDQINIFNTMSYSEWKNWYRKNYYKYR